MSPSQDAIPIAAAGDGKRTLLVQKSLVEETYRMFERNRCRQRVSVAYWYGTGRPQLGTSAVLSLGVPRAECNVVDYHVEEPEIARLGHAIRRQAPGSMGSLAQFYTQPSGDGRHSKNEDLNAISLRDGFLSLAAPYYGKRTEPLMGNITVHECWKGRWRVLGESERPGRIKIIDSLVDMEAG